MLPASLASLEDPNPLPQVEREVGELLHLALSEKEVGAWVVELIRNDAHPHLGSKH